MAKVPNGVNKLRSPNYPFDDDEFMRGFSDKGKGGKGGKGGYGSSSIVSALETVIDSLDDNEQKRAINLKNEYDLLEEQKSKLEREKKLRYNTASEFGLSNEAIKPVLAQYDKAIEASTEKLEKFSVEVGKSLEGFMKLIPDEKISVKDLEEISAIIELSKNAQNMNKSPKKAKDAYGNDKNLTSQVRDSASNLTKSLIDTSVSMFGLVTRPIEDLLGIDITDMLHGGLMSLFKKKDKKEDTGTFLSRKTRPRKEDLGKAGVIGASAIFIGDMLGNLFGKSKKESSPGGDDFLKSLGSSGAGKAGAGALATGAGIAMIAGGVIWGVVDAFKGMMKAEDWGVSNVSAAIGSFIGGSGEGGIKDMFKGMGKWALMGAGAGLLIASIPGAIAGGLIGAAIGGIAGFIGGEKISQGIQKVGDGISETWTTVKEKFKEIIGNIGYYFDVAITSVGGFFSGIWEGIKTGFFAVKDFFVGIPEWVAEKFISVKETISDVFEKAKDGIVSFFGKIKDFFLIDIPVWTVEKFELVKGTVLEVFGNAKDSISGFFGKIKDFFMTDIPLWVTEKFGLIKDTVLEVFGNAKDSISNFFGKIKDFFIVDIPVWVVEKFESVKGTVLDVFENAKDSIFGFFGKIKDFFVVDIPLWVTEKSESIKNTALEVFDLIKEKIHGILEIPKKIVVDLFDKLGIDIEDPAFFSDMLKSIKDSFFGFFDRAKDSIKGFFSSLNPKNWFGKDKDDKVTGTAETGPITSDDDKVPWWKFWAKDVDDAVIYKDGQIYRPHEDDNIIATKTAPLLLNKEGQAITTGFNPSIQSSKVVTNEIQSTFERTTTTDNSGYFNSMIGLLGSILKVLEDKAMSPIMNEINLPSDINFELLR